MSCVVKFTIGELNYELNNIDLDTKQDILPLIARLFTENGNNISVVKNALRDNYDGDKLVDIKLYKQGNSNLVPNYSGQELRTMFPEYKWGDYVPDVLLVDNLLWDIPSFSNLFTYVRTIGEDNQEHVSYIVPKAFVGQFSRISLMLTYLKQLKEFKQLNDEDYKALKDKAATNADANMLLMQYELLLGLNNKLTEITKELSAFYSDGTYQQYAYEYKLKTAGSVISETTDIISKWDKNYKLFLDRVAKIRKTEQQLEKLDPESKDAKVQKKIELLVKDKSKYETLVKESLKTLNYILLNYSTKRNVILSVLSENMLNFVDAHKDYKGLNNYLNNEKLSEHLDLTELDFQAKIDQFNKLLDDYPDYTLSENAYENINDVRSFVSANFDNFTKSDLNQDVDGNISVDNIVDAIIHDKSIIKKLPSGLLDKINIIKTLLLNKYKEIDFANKYMNTIAYQAIAHGNEINISEIIPIMIEHMPGYFSENDVAMVLKILNSNIELSTSDKAYITKNVLPKVKLYINEEFTLKQNKYYFEQKGDRFIMKQKTDKLLDKDLSYTKKAANAVVGQDIKSLNSFNELINIKPEVDEDDQVIRVNGYYIYKLKTTNGERYYALKDRVTALTPAAITKGFASIEEAKADAHTRFLNSKLFDGAVLLRYKNVPYLLSMSQTGRFWKKGEIAESIDLTSVDEEFEPGYGLLPVGQETVLDFYLWLDSKMNSSYANGIKENLKTLELIAAFRSLVKPYETNVYRMTKLAEAISKAPTNYFLVTLNTYSVQDQKYNTERRYTKFRQIRNYNPEAEQKAQPTKSFEQIKIDSVIDWFAMKNFFGRHGIHMELRNGKLLKEQIGTDQIDGFTQNGIIYINTDVATESKAFHELTHILLGLIKTYSGTQKGYIELLQNYILASNSSDAAKLLTILDNFQDVAKMSPDMFVDSFAKLYKQKLHDYADIIKSMNLSGEDAFWYVVEEMMADDYGSYLDKNYTPIEELFLLIDRMVQTLPMISDGDIKGAIIGSTKFNFFRSLTSFKLIFDQTGFSINPTKGVTSRKIKTTEFDIKEEHINNFISELASTKEKLTDILDDEGIFKHCE